MTDEEKIQKAIENLEQVQNQPVEIPFIFSARGN
jgi:hypothetical protein